MKSPLLELLPVLSEKSYKLSSDRFYVFTVPFEANKISIKKQIEEYYKVKVISVNILRQKGKAKRTVSITGKRYLNSTGTRKTVKKAYVYLAEGSTLPFFEAIEEEAAKEQKAQANFDKANEKVEKKAAKKSKADKKDDK